MATQRIELGMTADFLPHLKAWAGIRELVQNAKDGETEFGAKMEVRHMGDRLSIANYGVTLPREALLLGYTTKRDSAMRRDLIGQFGSGLKLGALALVRAGIPVEILTGNESWKFSIQRSERYRSDVLVCDISTRSSSIDRIFVSLPLSADDWEVMRHKFLWLPESQPKASEAVKTDQGTLLLADRFRSSIYVKGIWVSHNRSSEFGYDFPNAEVNHERQMVDQYDIEAYQARIWQAAFAQRPDLLGQHLFGLLEADSREVRDLLYGVSPESGITDAVVARFKQQHGELAVPCATTGETQELAHLPGGRTGVVVTSQVLRKVLQTAIGSPESLKAGLKDSVTRAYSWADLSESERMTLTGALGVLIDAAPRISQAQEPDPKLTIHQDQYSIVDFASPDLQGLATTGATPGSPGSPQKWQLARSLLTSRAATLRVMVHELAHVTSQAGDGDRAHVAEIERIWSAITESLLK